METKKSKKAAIERYRSTWLMLGCVVTLAFMFMAFEWSRYDVSIDTSAQLADLVFEADIEIPRTYDQPTPPPPPEPSASDILTIIDTTDPVDEKPMVSSEYIPDVGVTVKYVAPEVVEDVPTEVTIFDVVENMPEFKGGQAALMQYLSKNIKYPSICQEQDIQGRVIIQFVVNTDGSIVDAQVVRSVHPHLDKEALRVINSMPAWKPGMQRNQPVRVRYTVPVTFKLQ